MLDSSGPGVRTERNTLDVRGLRDWLATVPWVERVNDAEQGDGGPGCSVVWLK